MRRLPQVWGGRAVHQDPDFDSAVPTYGDNCRTAGRAFALRRARSGDLIVFLARLHDADGRAGFHLVASLEIGAVLADVAADPGPGWWDGNAHVLRARATGAWNQFWVFRGTLRSRRFPYSRALDRGLAGALLPDISWPPTRTELQVIGSHTRAVRRLTGAAEAHLRSLCPS